MSNEEFILHVMGAKGHWMSLPELMNYERLAKELIAERAKGRRSDDQIREDYIKFRDKMVTEYNERMGYN